MNFKSLCLSTLSLTVLGASFTASAAPITASLIPSSECAASAISVNGACGIKLNNFQCFDVPGSYGLSHSPFGIPAAADSQGRNWLIKFATPSFTNQYPININSNWSSITAKLFSDHTSGNAALLETNCFQNASHGGAGLKQVKATFETSQYSVLNPINALVHNSTGNPYSFVFNCSQSSNAMRCTIQSIL